jgi:hypothetical protein
MLSRSNSLPCGHTFCHRCLWSWFHRQPEDDGTDRTSIERKKRNLVCPQCRRRVREAPFGVFSLRNVAELLKHPEDEFGDPESAAAIQSEAEAAARKQAKERAQEADRSWGGLFNEIRPRSAIIDDEDGVRRCPGCNWEIEDGYCSRW